MLPFCRRGEFGNECGAALSSETQTQLMTTGLSCGCQYQTVSPQCAPQAERHPPFQSPPGRCVSLSTPLGFVLLKPAKSPSLQLSAPNSNNNNNKKLLSI